MKKYTIAIFDLDGTVIDSSEGVTKSVTYALDKHGYAHGDLDSLKCFIGPPLREQFMTYCNADEEKGNELVRTYREYYSEKGAFECLVYEGIPYLLKSLKDAGFKVLLATSKAEKFAKVILDHFSMSEFFDCICGSYMDNSRTAKDEIIEYALTSTGLEKSKESAVMIGDSKFDVLGARKAGIDAVAVSYGFGSMEELIESSPVKICKNVEELRDYLLY